MKKLFLSLFLFCFVSMIVHATIDFTNYNSHMVLKENASKFVANNAEKILGWSELSVVDDFGNEQASSWVEGYSGSVVISTGGGTSPANNLIAANSNAIVSKTYFGGFTSGEKAELLDMLPTHSNAFAYCCKNTSNALLYGIKNNSHAIVNAIAITPGLFELNSAAQENNNAFLYCCKHTSNALAYGLKNNSNDIADIMDTFADISLIKNTSHAFVYCCKNVNNTLNAAITIYDTHKIYSSDATEQNFVLFKNGFTVNANKRLALNMPVPVMGVINLNDLGIIELQNDLYLSSNAHLTNGGILDGNGHTLVLSGNVIIPANKRLRIKSDTIIDGHGATLFLDSYSRMSVDNNVTLTLKNIRIKNTQNTPSVPMIDLSGTGSKLALQDVELVLSDDFYVNRGSLFIHDNVLISGVSDFVYRSGQKSYIADASILYFDKGSRFFYDGSSSYLIKMLSENSRICFDGSTLQTGNSGIRLSAGALYLDNNVQLTCPISTHIIFGDSSQPGDTGDLDVQVLAAAHVTITGKVLDDSSF